MVKTSFFSSHVFFFERRYIDSLIAAVMKAIKSSTAEAGSWLGSSTVTDWSAILCKIYIKNKLRDYTSRQGDAQSEIWYGWVSVKYINFNLITMSVRAFTVQKRRELVTVMSGSAMWWWKALSHLQIAARSNSVRITCIVVAMERYLHSQTLQLVFAARLLSLRNR